MNTIIFALLFCASLIYEVVHLHAMPWPIRLMVLPTAALVLLITLYERINAMPKSHWLYKVPGVAWIARLVQQGMSIPFEQRVAVLGFCFAVAYLAILVPVSS